MESQVEKFDPSKLMEGVKDRIKATFVSLIPDDLWNQMVEKEIYIFTTGRIIPHHNVDYTSKDENGNYIIHDWEERVPYSDKDIYDKWGRLEKPAEVSPLRAMIREELYKKFRESLIEYINGEGYTAHFNKYGKPEIGKAIQKVLVDNADTIFFSVMENIMQAAFNEMRYKLSNLVN